MPLSQCFQNVAHIVCMFLQAFRSNDFKEAVTYYCRSICLLPTAASYNNRALARMLFICFQND
ncbi:hypothetical protein DPMN_190992 [Dreissena polymorpha]|uniref:Uncharacterized protein n=1 Tax=Dreissena polymorpha TaxID=45954 RepID=A0A9D4BDW6_DREPO|nr:hypothetical protein DPMN_190992 [Dreissena polymorpha]